MNPLLLDIPSELLTERLLLRIPRAGDGAVVNPAVHESLAELRPWMPWAVGDVPVEETESFCRRAAARFLTREDLHFLMFDRAAGEYVGSTGLHRIKWDVPVMEIGYWLRTSRCGRGLMVDAVRALTKFAFDTLHAERVEIRMDDRNERSWRVAERAGLQLEGVLRHDSRGPNGDLRDSRIYALIRSEFA